LTPHNQPKVESLLQSGVSSEHSVVVIPAANHYFQHANTGFDEEHDRLDETVAPDVVELIAAFLSRRSGTSRP
jgi:phage-related protein